MRSPNLPSSFRWWWWVWGQESQRLFAEEKGAESEGRAGHSSLALLPQVGLPPPTPPPALKPGSSCLPGTHHHRLPLEGGELEGSWAHGLGRGAPSWAGRTGNRRPKCHHLHPISCNLTSLKMSVSFFCPYSGQRWASPCRAPWASEEGLQPSKSLRPRGLIRGPAQPACPS